MKQIIADIIEQEKEKNAIKTNIFPVSYSEYYKKHVFDKNFKLTKTMGLLYLPLYADGYINYVKGANVAGFMKVAKAMMAQGIV